MRKNLSESKVVLAYISVCIIWGSTYLAMRIAVAEFPPELFAGLRFFLAGIIILIYSLAKKKEFPSSRKDYFKAAIPGLFLLVGANGLVMYAEQWVHSGITSIILSATPLFIVIIEFVFFRDRKLGRVGIILILLGFTGTTLLIITGQGIGSIDIKGGAIVLTASLLWAAGTIASQRFKSSSGNFITHVSIQMIAAGIILSIIGLSMGELSRVNFSPNVIFALIYLVVFGSIIGYSSNIYVLTKWPASIAVTSAYINPIVAVILGVIILAEEINLKSIVFMLLILGAVVGLHFKKYIKK